MPLVARRALDAWLQSRVRSKLMWADPLNVVNERTLGFTHTFHTLLLGISQRCVRRKYCNWSYTMRRIEYVRANSNFRHLHPGVYVVHRAPDDEAIVVIPFGGFLFKIGDFPFILGDFLWRSRRAKYKDKDTRRYKYWKDTWKRSWQIELGAEVGVTGVRIFQSLHLCLLRTRSNYILELQGTGKDKQHSSKSSKNVPWYYQGSILVPNAIAVHQWIWNQLMQYEKCHDWSIFLVKCLRTCLDSATSDSHSYEIFRTFRSGWCLPWLCTNPPSTVLRAFVENWYSLHANQIFLQNYGTIVRVVVVSGVLYTSTCGLYYE